MDFVSFSFGSWLRVGSLLNGRKYQRPWVSGLIRKDEEMSRLRCDLIAEKRCGVHFWDKPYSGSTIIGRSSAGQKPSSPSSQGL
jgi:hypothetical protein